MQSLHAYSLIETMTKRFKKGYTAFELTGGPRRIVETWIKSASFLSVWTRANTHSLRRKDAKSQTGHASANTALYNDNGTKRVTSQTFFLLYSTGFRANFFTGPCGWQVHETIPRVYKIYWKMMFCGGLQKVPVGFNLIGNLRST